MSIDDQPVTTKANGHYSKLFPRPEVDDQTPQAPEQAESGNIVPSSAEPRRRVRVRDVATHRHTKTALRHGAYVVAGGRKVARNTWDAHSTARHQRWMRVAEATKDNELAKHWAEEAEKVREARHRRRMAALHAPVVAAKSLVYGAAGLFGLGVVLTMCGDHQSPLMPLTDVSRAIEFVFSTVSRVWDDTRYLLPFVLAGALWAARRKGEAVPQWLVTSTEGDDLTIDERTISLAIKALRIPQVTDYLKKGLPLQYLVSAREDGRGTYAEIRLPGGVSAEKIAKRRTDLATSLHRASKEVFPTVGSEAGILKLWVADKGRLEEGAGPYPLLNAGTADFFKGLPLGRTLRGDQLLAPVAGRNTIVGGMPDQGKSSLARVLMAGASLDPSCELRIWVPDANFDFELFERRASMYRMGPEDEVIEAILEDLELTHEECTRRGKILTEMKEPEVTRKIADKDHRLHPVMCLLEEAHVALGHPKYGKAISKLAVDTVKICRKRAIHLVFSTQAPTKDSIPRDVTRNCSNGFAFAVGDHVANDALLGQGAYKAGHRATELIPGVDKGVCLAKGLTAERSELLQVHFVSITRDNDQLTPLIDRAVEAVEEYGTAVLTAPERIEPRDLLDDLVEVMAGEARVRTEEVVHRLKQLAGAFYKDWTTTELTAGLRGTGAEPYKSGTMHVSLERVLEAIEARENERDNDENDASEE